MKSKHNLHIAQHLDMGIHLQFIKNKLSFLEEYLSTNRSSRTDAFILIAQHIQSPKIIGVFLRQVVKM